MSKVDLNALVNGFSGKLGNAVLRRRGGRTYIAQRPKERTEMSDKQKAHQEKFRRAAAYAKGRMLDPVAKAEYENLAKQKEFMSAFSVAVTDYLKQPKIESVKTDGYTGELNDAIAVKALDDFKLVGVKVTITLPTGVVHETGNATFDSVNLDWKYVATKANTTLTGTKIKAVAIDRPGNEATLEKVM
jgi:hypothetical protein